MPAVLRHSYNVNIGLPTIAETKETGRRASIVRIHKSLERRENLLQYRQIVVRRSKR